MSTREPGIGHEWAAVKLSAGSPDPLPAYCILCGASATADVGARPGYDGVALMSVAHVTPQNAAAEAPCAARPPEGT